MLELARRSAAESEVPEGQRAHEYLAALEHKVLWLACWMIHHANHIRASRDGLKVGGHQASCASIATLMTALYFDVLRPGDRVAVKPHASPVYHAIQYLLGRQTQDKLARFRALGGAQAYPSRTKDGDGVDFSTGSVGLGAAITLFASLTQDLLHERRLLPTDQPKGRMVALVGDAELDEGNVFEALLEGWKHDIRNVWWVIDYNRQSLDRVVPERLFAKIEDFFGAVGWQVVTLKYGKLLQAAFAQPDGAALRQWIDDCPNDLYSALTFKGGAGWRQHLEHDLGHLPGIRTLLAEHDDDELARLMTNLGGHDLDLVREAFQAVDRRPAALLHRLHNQGLPAAVRRPQGQSRRADDARADGRVQEAASGRGRARNGSRFAGLDIAPDELEVFLRSVPFAARTEAHASARVPVPATLPVGRRAKRASTQEAFGRIMGELARDEGELAARIITTSPDVTVSTSLGPWVSRRSVFNRAEHADVFKQERLASSQLWAEKPARPARRARYRRK